MSLCSVPQRCCHSFGRWVNTMMQPPSSVQIVKSRSSTSEKLKRRLFFSFLYKYKCLRGVCPRRNLSSSPSHGSQWLMLGGPCVNRMADSGRSFQILLVRCQSFDCSVIIFTKHDISHCDSEPFFLSLR